MPARALRAAAIFLAGAVAALTAAYALGLHESDDDPHTGVYTLRDGDVAVRPEAATRCEASAEGGIPNLFCTRAPSGRHQIIFYADCVLVWPLARGPDGPPFSYGWDPARDCS